MVRYFVYSAITPKGKVECSQPSWGRRVCSQPSEVKPERAKLQGNHESGPVADAADEPDIDALLVSVAHLERRAKRLLEQAEVIARKYL